MAEKVIGLRLQINGVSQVITNIKQLEEELGKAREKLSTVTIGSNEFKKLTTEIRNAETEVGKLRQQTEGLTLEKQLEGFGKFTGGITAGFAAASAAAQLFGNETEDISKAATTAMNLLTLATGARAAAETLAGAKILATTIATKAQTIATNLSTISLRTLYATMLANPIGAVIAAIGLLVTALIVFSEETEDTTKAQRELNKVTSEEAIKLQALNKVLTNVNSTNEERLGAINELKKAYPGFNAFIDKENRLTKDGVKFVEAKTKALIAQAQINKILEKIAENNNKQLEIENRTVEESIGGWTKFKSTIVGLSGPYGQLNKLIIESEDAAKNNAEEIGKLNTENGKLQQSLNGLLGQQQKNNETLDEYNKKLEEQAEKEKQTADAAEAAEKRKAALDANQKRRNELLSTDLQRKLADLKLSYEQEVNLAKKNGEDLLLVDKTYQKRRSEIIKQAKIDISNLTKEVTNELLDIEGKSYKQRVTEIENFESKRREEIQKGIDELKKAGVATQKEIDEASKAIEDSQKIQAEKILLVQKEINTNYLQGQVNLFDEAAKLQTEFFGTEQELEDNKNILFKSTFVKYRDNELEKIKLALESAGVEQTQIDETLKKYEDYFFKLGLLQLNNTKIQEANAKVDKQLTDAQLELQIEYYEKIKEAQQTYKNDEKGLKKELGLIESDYQLLSLNLQKQALQNKLSILSEDPTLNPDELKRIKAELLKIETEFNTKVQEGQKSVTDSAKKNNEDLLAGIARGIQEFSNALNQIASLTAQSFAFQLERLEIDYQNSLTQVVGDTEEANQKRVELETMYQNKKKRIERDAQISSLKFTLAQAIASGAQAFVNALASLPPPANAIVAGVQAVVTAAQIAVIGKQLSFIQSQPLARGGFLRGASHEQGGIKYQGGAIEVEGNESVINRRSTLQYGPLLSQINQQGGGRPLLINNIMDSRMAEVLASVKSEPIRAYVLEQDITKSQAINRRLEELASY
jgi:hypothetical protein